MNIKIEINLPFVNLSVPEINHAKDNVTTFGRPCLRIPLFPWPHTAFEKQLHDCLLFYY